MAAPSGIQLNHIARSTADVPRLAEFYTSVLGFRRLDTPNFGDFAVAWLHLPPSFSLHLIQRNPDSALPEASAVRDPAALPRGHHIAFGVENYEEFVKGLRERGVELFEKSQPDGRTKQCFFFDPDGEFSWLIAIICIPVIVIIHKFHIRKTCPELEHVYGYRKPYENWFDELKRRPRIRIKFSKMSGFS